MTGLPVVGADIHGFETAATRFYPLPGILCQGKAPAIKFHNQVIGYAGAFAYGQILHDLFQQFTFTTGLQRNPQLPENPDHFFQYAYFLLHGNSDEIKNRLPGQSLLDFWIHVHKARNTTLDTHGRRFLGDHGEILQVILNLVGLCSIETNRIKSPVHGFRPIKTAKAFHLPQTLLETRKSRFQQHGFGIDAEVKEQMITIGLQFSAIVSGNERAEILGPEYNCVYIRRGSRYEKSLMTIGIFNLEAFLLDPPHKPVHVKCGDVRAT